MKNFVKVGACAAALALPAALFAGTEPFFNPLTQSGVVAAPDSTVELSSPWLAPAGISQDNLMSMQEVEADLTQSIQRVNAGNVSSMFDMLAYDPSGRYIFIPHETPFGAGISRYDTELDRNDLLFAGDQGGIQGDWSNDYAAFDPARWTPNGTVIAGEEWSGLGRLVELLNPTGAAPNDPTASALTEGVDYRVVDSIARVSHEGINFSKQYPNQVLYYIDEWNSGSIYMLCLNTPGDYQGGGTTYVLSVDAFAATGGVASDLWNDPANANAARFGQATWVPITDQSGNPLAGLTNPFRDGPTNDPRSNDDTRGGRVVADEVGGTPYGRPEDMEIGVLPNGNEVIYVATTSERAVIAIEMTSWDTAMVRQLATADTPTNVGFPATTGSLNSPDNLAQDALGNIYIIEDAPNGSSTGGDIWFVRDTDTDGVAESLDHFMSLQVAGSESTGMIFHPQDPTRFVVAVQHPTSTNLDVVPNGFGDAVWEFDLNEVVPPICKDRNSHAGEIYSWKVRRWIRSCSKVRDFNFVKALERAGRPKIKKRRWRQ